MYLDTFLNFDTFWDFDPFLDFNPFWNLNPILDFLRVHIKILRTPSKPYNDSTLFQKRSKAKRPEPAASTLIEKSFLSLKKDYESRCARCVRIGLTIFYLTFLALYYTPLIMLLMYKNVPVVTICWVTFFAFCFLIFLVLSLCSESHCSCCRCFRCCREGTSTVARIPSMVTTTCSSRDSLHHSLMRNSQMMAGQQPLHQPHKNNSASLLPTKASEFYC